jgi:hypothetical protein
MTLTTEQKREWGKNRCRIGDPATLAYNRARSASGQTKEYWSEYGARPEVKARRAEQVRIRKYGMTNDQRNALYEAQDKKCALCRLPMELDKSRVDHDHGCCPGVITCGKCVRGLLHVRCNTILAGVEDQEFHKQALTYLGKS